MKTIILEELVLELAKPPREDREIVPILTYNELKKDPVYYGIYQTMKSNSYWAEFSNCFASVFGFSPSKLVPDMENVEGLSKEEQIKAINNLRLRVVEHVLFERLRKSSLKNKNEDKFKQWVKDQSSLDEKEQSPLYRTLIQKKISSK